MKDPNPSVKSVVMLLMVSAVHVQWKEWMEGGETRHTHRLNDTQAAHIHTYTPTHSVEIL